MAQRECARTKNARALALILVSLSLALAVDSSSDPGSPMKNFSHFVSSPISPGKNSPGYYPYSKDSRVKLLPTTKEEKKDINTALQTVKRKDEPLNEGTLAHSDSKKWRQDLQPGPPNKYNFQAQRNSGKGVKPKQGTSASTALVDKSFGDTLKTKQLANAATRASLKTGRKVSVLRHPYTPPARLPTSPNINNSGRRNNKENKRRG